MPLSSVSSIIKGIFCTPEYKGLFLGLDGTGRTTALYQLKLGEDIHASPTIGFNVETVEHKGNKLHLWDVGGCDKIRALWRHYYAKVDFLVFFVDSTDTERLGRITIPPTDPYDEGSQPISDNPNSAAGLLYSTACCSTNPSKVVLVLCSKQDKPGAASVADIADALCIDDLRYASQHGEEVDTTSGMQSSQNPRGNKHPLSNNPQKPTRKPQRHVHIMGCSANTGDGLHAGMDWVLAALNTPVGSAVPSDAVAAGSNEPAPGPGPGPAPSTSRAGVGVSGASGPSTSAGNRVSTSNAKGGSTRAPSTPPRNLHRPPQVTPTALATLQQWQQRADQEAGADQDLSDGAFLAQFHAATLPRWDHYTHLRVAWLFLRKYGYGYGHIDDGVEHGGSSGRGSTGYTNRPPSSSPPHSRTPSPTAEPVPSPSHARITGAERLFTGLRSFIERSPRTRRSSGGGGAARVTTFHETLTFFWVHMVHYAMVSTGSDSGAASVGASAASGAGAGSRVGSGEAVRPGDEFRRFLSSNPYLCDGQLFAQYYSREVLFMQPDARTRVVLPDLAPLPSIVVPVHTSTSSTGTSNASSHGYGGWIF